MEDRQQSLYYPNEIILEVTNHCNLNCRHCHFHGQEAVKKRPLGAMKKETWLRALEAIGTLPKPVTLLTHGAGEPLLYPQLEALLTEAKKIEGLNVGFMTNAMLLNDRWADFLIDHQIDLIAFSIDGTEKATHDYFRRGADLEKIERHVFNLINKKQKRNCPLPRLTFNMVAYPEIIDQSEAYVQKWLPHASAVSIATFRPIGSRRLWQDAPPVDFRPCPLLYHQFVIGFDGTVGLCCEDINSTVNLGSILHRPIEEIYNSDAIKRYRHKHETNDIDGLPLCRDCDVWAGDIPLASERLRLGEMSVQRTETPAFTSYKKSED